MTYDFDERLAFSQGERGERDALMLKRIIRGCEKVIKTDVETDKKGIDYIATLKGGAEIGIDIKAREKGASKFWKYGEAELALETWSVIPPNRDNEDKGKIGWTLSNETNVDYIFFTFDVADWDKCYLLPYQLLRMTFRKNVNDWFNRYFHARQTSNDWQSAAVFVPVSVVIGAINAEMQYEMIGK